MSWDQWNNSGGSGNGKSNGYGNGRNNHWSASNNNDNWSSNGWGGGQEDTWSGKEQSWGESHEGQGDAWSGWGQENKKDSGWGYSDNWADQLEDIQWSTQTLLQIEKDFYHEHPDVQKRSEHECDQIRNHFNIEVIESHGRPVPKPITTFVESGIPDWLLEGVQNRGFDRPTPIQIQSFPAASSGRDLVGIAETGSGKTVAYLLPMIIHIMAQPELEAGQGPVGIVLAPNRELAMQIEGVAREFSGRSGLRCLCIYGGTSTQDQKWKLQERNDIIVATPGRFIQALNEKWTNLLRVTFVVLDEADLMLNMGFGDQVKLILSQIRPDRQTLMFSATWPEEVMDLAKAHCKEDPLFIRVGGDKLALCRNITQNVLVLQDDEMKFKKLHEAIVRAGCDKRGASGKCLVFCRSKVGVDELVEKLHSMGIHSYGMHSGKEQSERTYALEQFKDHDVSILVSTDMMGRGHDIPKVRYVINYDAPNQVEAYVHRIGRTGRAGEKGISMTFISEREGRIAELLLDVLEQCQQKISDKHRKLVEEYQARFGQGEKMDWGEKEDSSWQKDGNYGGWDNYQSQNQPQETQHWEAGAEPQWEVGHLAAPAGVDQASPPGQYDV